MPNGPYGRGDGDAGEPTSGERGARVPYTEMQGLKVLLLCTQSPYEGPPTGAGASMKGGAELSLKLIGESLAARGHAVYFLTRRGLVVNREDTVNGVTVIHRFFWSVPLLGRWSEAFRRLNRVLEEYQWDRCIQRVVDRYRVQIIHTFATHPDTYVAARVGRRRGIPLVQRIAGMYWRWLWDSDPSTRGRILYTFRNVDRFLPTSTNIQRAFVEFAEGEGIHVGDITSVLDIGIDLARMDQLAGEGAGEGGGEHVPLLLCVAGFKTRQKRQDLLIEALALLRDRGVSVRTWFVGDGPNRSAMEERAQRLGLSEHARFIGNVSHDDVIRLMGRATACVHPSDFEGLSKTIAEAMYACVPVIASDAPGIDLLISDENAILSENTPESFADCIQMLLEDPSRGEAIARRARDNAKERFDSRRNVVEYERLFEEEISSR